jgi:hypothetical protein
MKNIGKVLAVACVLQLAACGGGSGGSGGSGTTESTPPPSSTTTPPPPTTPQPTAQDEANAKAAAVGASLNLSTGLATLSWTDTFATASGYNIQQQTDSTTWTTIDTVPGQGGNKQAITWSAAVNATQTLRVQAVETSYDVTLLTQSGQQQVQIAVPSPSPAIVLNQTQPVSGTVQVTVNNAGAYSSAAYYVDLLTLSSSTAAASNFPVNWDTTSTTNGAHLVIAALQANPDFNVQVRSSVQVANSAVAISMSADGCTIVNGGGCPNPTLYGSFNPVILASGATVDVTATSAAGIQSVTLSMDGTLIGTLTTPMAGSNIYAFTISGASGQHVLTAQAVDNSGQSATTTGPITISNPPQLSVTSPVDGGLVNGTLHLAGTTTTDKSGAVTATATLGNLPVLSSTAASFSADFSLSGVVAGDYTLTVTATDSTGLTATQSFIVTVTSSPSLVYSSAVSIGSNGILLATDPTSVVYQAPDGSVHLLSGSSDITLVTVTTSNGLGQWALSNGNVFALANTGTQIDVVFFNTSGSRTDLGTLGPFNSNYVANLLTVHWPWALASYWTVPAGQATWTGTYTFFNAQTGQTLVPPLPEISGSEDKVDFFTSAAGLTLYYMTDLSSNGGFNPIGIDSWNQTSNVITPLATGSLWQLRPQTDGTRVAWEVGALGDETGPYSLISYDIASATQATLSTTMTQFQLADGVLAWVESGSNTTTIKASVGSTVTTISALTSTVFYGTGGGYVLFAEASKLYVWSAAGGRQLVFDAVPDVARISGTTVYFTNGKQQLLYSVPLN